MEVSFPRPLVKEHIDTTTSSILHCLAVQRVPQLNSPSGSTQGIAAARLSRETEAVPPDTGSGLLSGFAMAAAT